VSAGSSVTDTPVPADRPQVTLVHLERVLTPDGKFHHAIEWHGRMTVVRQHDGIHLTPAGARIAAELVVQAIRSGS